MITPSVNAPSEAISQPVLPAVSPEPSPWPAIIASTPSPADAPPIRKMSNVEIFAAMKPKICWIETPRGKMSGFFIGKHGQVITAMHGLVGLHTKDIYVVHNGQRYLVSTAEWDRDRKLDLCLLKTVEPIETDYFDYLPKNVPLQEGVKTFFCGFPFGQVAHTFHKGLISAVFHEAEIQYFSIDATVVPGHSGSPVTLLHEGKLYLAGVVVSQVADLPANLSSLENALRSAQGTILVSGTGPSVDTVAATLTCLRTITKNMSTGIGKVIDARQISQLFGATWSAKLEGAEQPSISCNALPVVHGNLMVSFVSNKHVRNVSRRIVEDAIDFINSFKTEEKKSEFYSKLWGDIGTIYRFGSCRLDIQAPLEDAVNLQIQVDDITIATLLVSRRFSEYVDNKHKINELINYLTRKFVGELNDYRTTSKAYVFRINPRL